MNSDTDKTGIISACLKLSGSWETALQQKLKIIADIHNVKIKLKSYYKI